MISLLLPELVQLQDTRVHTGLDVARLTQLENDHGITLPEEHKTVLQWSNGLEFYAGYIRLFGLYTAQSIDAVGWNEPECWKFAWADRCSGYWCFGETAWGDQYAYSMKEWRKGGRAGVYLLDALSMTPQIVASSFVEFLEDELVPSARNPHDDLLIQARQRFGPLEVSSHLAYIPSVLLGGIEDINNVQVMNARAAMICNGDVAIQLDSAPSQVAVKGVQSYVDELQRTRLRLVWMED
jgi:hypothetical protein